MTDQVGGQLRVKFTGGPLDKWEADFPSAPLRVEVMGALYERIDDPDTGEFLGGYAFKSSN